MSEWLDTPGDSDSKDITGEVEAADVKPQNTNHLPLSPMHASQPSLRPSPRRGHSQQARRVYQPNQGGECSCQPLPLPAHPSARLCPPQGVPLFSFTQKLCTD